jgi:hypothetical protein
VELKGWLERRKGIIAHRWQAEIQIREGRRGDDGDGLLNSFLKHLVSFLPPCLGEHRQTGEEVWQIATHLYGSLALRRGLSAGEVVEELQLLREVVLRLLLESPPAGVQESTGSRDILFLNRVLDLGVVWASVAYVDDLFFAHLQESGIPGGVTPEVVAEIEGALESFRSDLGTSDPSEWTSNDGD